MFLCKRRQRLLPILFIALGLCISCQKQTNANTPKHKKHKKHKKKRDLNWRFLRPGVSARSWKQRFESQKRSVWRYRYEIVKRLKLKPGTHVADIGAGSGAYLKPFVDAIGPKGLLYAVDLAPAFVKYLKRRAKAKGYKQVRVIQSTTTKTKLPANSVDLVFVCDTYHHFDKPGPMLADIHRALRPGGRLVIIEFERIPGVSSAWILGHVKYNKQEIIAQISQHHFAFQKEIKIPGLKDNYVVTFRPKTKTTPKAKTTDKRTP